MAIKFNMMLADLNVRVNCRYDTTCTFCREYLCEDENFVIDAKTTDSEIENEISLVPGASLQDAEELCIYRSIAKQLPDFSRFVFHGAAITYKGKGLLFTAPSGTGKTTHIRLWMKQFGEDVKIVNGDKPIISLENGATVYGTPWAGKEKYQNNTSAPITAVCIIRQGTDNAVKKLKPAEAVKFLMQQIYLPREPETLSKTLSLLSDLLNTVPCYYATIDISKSAVDATFNAMINS